MKKQAKLLIFLSIIILALPYLKTELLTILHGEETSMLYEQTGIISSDNYHKVLKYNADNAEVLYITSDDISKCCFVKNNDNWQLESWQCILSKNGSASNYFYPFYFFKS